MQSELDPSTRVGADPRTVPHKVWLEWEAKLQLKYIRLVRLNRNLIDLIWINRPPPNTDAIKVQPLDYAGEKWQSKLKTLRKHLIKDQCDAMIVTSLTEIAYLLNLRGTDFPYTPVFTSYLIVSHDEAYLYVNRAKVTLGVTLHLNTEPCITECVKSVHSLARRLFIG